MNRAGQRASTSTSRGPVQRLRTDDPITRGRLADLYAPLVIHWGQRWALPELESAGIVLAVASHVARFREEHRRRLEMRRICCKPRAHLVQWHQGTAGIFGQVSLVNPKGFPVTDTHVELGEGSEKTSLSLLVRVKAKDQEAWRRFTHLYSPLVHNWCRRFGLQDADAADVGQDVFRTVFLSIDGFHHDRPGDSLRGWLWTITRTRALDLMRRKDRAAELVGGAEVRASLFELPDGHAEDGPTEEDENLVVRRAVDMVLDGCKQETRQAFLRVVIAGESPADVARSLGMTINAVYLAKSHVLRRIREEFAQLVDI